MLASPMRSLTREQHLAKFARCLEFAAIPLPRSTEERLIEAVDGLEALADVRLLARLATGVGPVL